MEEIDGLGIPLRSLWPTLLYRRVAGVSPLLSIGWWYFSLLSPKFSVGKRRAWFLPDDRHTASLVGLRGGWRHARTKSFTRIYVSNAAVPGPKPPSTIKAVYLNCKIRPYIPNPLRCFKCPRFGHSQTSCRGQLTCSRCASVGHASTDWQSGVEMRQLFTASFLRLKTLS
ncbi:uncharacterized protein TNCV_3067701 [Trichonephila clavipes]|nr:uncharacterized protein TNCV_3067701 [Trichonephila clavipes]